MRKFCPRLLEKRTPCLSISSLMSLGLVRRTLPSLPRLSLLHRRCAPG